MGRIAVAAVAALVVIGAPATGANAVEGPVTVTHHLAMEGLATPSGSTLEEVFAGRAVQDGYNRNVVYRGYTSPEWPPFGFWSGGTFTLIDRDQSTLTVEVDTTSGTDRMQNFPGGYQYRSGDVVVTEGTGRFAGTTGTGHVELLGSTVRLEGDLVLTLDA